MTQRQLNPKSNAYLHGDIRAAIQSPSRSGIQFTDSELDLIGELLNVANGSLRDLLAQVHAVRPENALCESLRQWIEQATDIRARIEAR